MQNLKIDSIAEGEPVLKGSLYVPHMLDDNKVAFNTGKLMWNEDRFKHVPGRMGHGEYEAMCRTIAETSKWELARPESKFEPGFAAYTSRPMDYERRVVRPLLAARIAIWCCIFAWLIMRLLLEHTSSCVRSLDGRCMYDCGREQNPVARQQIWITGQYRPIHCAFGICNAKTAGHVVAGERQRC